MSEELIAIGMDAATSAGEVLLARQDGATNAVRTKAGPFDLVTSADTAAEKLIRREITRRRPRDSVLGEEGGPSGNGSVRWLVDPLDGTVNYLNRLPAWAVSIAAEVNGVVVAAIVHAPALGHTFTGQLNAGSWRDGKRLTGPSTHRLADAVVATGFTASAAGRTRQLMQLGWWLPHVRDVRCHGSAALELCAVAAGELDAYVESDLQTWDVAAGVLIAREAGAFVAGGPGTNQPLVAAAPALADPLVRLITRTQGHVNNEGS